MKGLAAALFFDGKEEWAHRSVDRAVQQGLPEAAIVGLLLALPSQRSTWDSAASLGEGVNAAYWKHADFFAHNQSPEDLEFAIGQMVDADRAPEVVERIANDPTAISSSNILRVLRSATEDPWPSGGNDAVMFQWGGACQRL